MRTFRADAPLVVAEADEAEAVVAQFLWPKDDDVLGYVVDGCEN
jgi:hypothetical protein